MKSIEQAIAEERDLKPGAYAINFYLTEPVGDNDLQSIENHLRNSGVDVIGVSQARANGLWAVSVKYRKQAVTRAVGFLPLAIIPLVAFGFVAVLVGIGIFNIETLANNIGKLLLITLGGVALIGLAMRKPIESVATAYVARR